MMNVELRDVPALAAALSAAESCGLLTALSERCASPADLAARCRVDRRACTHVLDVLDAFGLTTRDGDCYGAGPDLLEQAARPVPIRDIESELWRHAAAFLHTGTPRFIMDAAPAERDEIYRDIVPQLARMFEPFAAQLAARVDVKPQSILEVGCGSGVWSLAFAERWPETRVTGLDLPAVLEQFRARATALGMVNRVDTIEGDMHTVAIPRAQWDLVIIANVLRLEPCNTARALLERIAPAIRAGGSLLVVDALASQTTASRRARALYAFHLALRTRSGRAHSAAEIGQWMKDVGCEAPVDITFDDAPLAAGALGALIARKR
jgi:ubiquinone/menaquinone biosynthesis C-methylase UbiE